MKVFTAENSPWVDKVNFIDKNNVVLGFDLNQGCCEHASWFISPLIDINKTSDESRPSDEILEPYVFDPGFYGQNLKEDTEEGGSATFRLIAAGQPTLYVTIFNSHNGYYAHGFEFKNNDKKIISDCI